MTAVARGKSVPMIGNLLGNAQVQTTARYAPVAADPVKASFHEICCPDE